MKLVSYWSIRKREVTKNLRFRWSNKMESWLSKDCLIWWKSSCCLLIKRKSKNIRIQSLVLLSSKHMHQKLNWNQQKKPIWWSKTPQWLSKITLQNTTRLLERKELVDLLECSVANDFLTENSLPSNLSSQNRRLKDRVSWTRLESCSLAIPNQSFNATKLLISRVVSGSSLNSWMAVRLPTCLKSSKETIQKASASTRYIRQFKVLLIYIARTSFTETLNLTTSCVKKPEKSSWLTSDMLSC